VGTQQKDFKLVNNFNAEAKSAAIADHSITGIVPNGTFGYCLEHRPPI
jgi:hypothetical protein